MGKFVLILILYFSEKKPLPVEDIHFFEAKPPGFLVKFTVTPLEFFCIDSPWKSTFFPQFLVYPLGIFH